MALGEIFDVWYSRNRSPLIRSALGSSAWRNPRASPFGALFDQTSLLLPNFTFAFCSAGTYLPRISNLAPDSDDTNTQDF